MGLPIVPEGIRARRLERAEADEVGRQVGADLLRRGVRLLREQLGRQPRVFLLRQLARQLEAAPAEVQAAVRARLEAAGAATVLPEGPCDVTRRGDA